jgi:probable rRNA maturation factor
MGVEVIIESDHWAATDLAVLANKAVSATCQHLNMNASAWEIAILATDDASITQLNHDFRGKGQPTNVLSWPSEERGAANPGERPATPSENFELGDIAVGFETCEREAIASGKPLENHLLHLIVHGTLHLLGYDHQTGLDADLMETTEIAILVKLGVPDPYNGNGAKGLIDDGKD